MKTTLSCGHAANPTECTPGYAVKPDGSRICYACADKEQRADLLDRSRPFTAYVSGDGKAITTWTGGHLMRVRQSWPCKLTRFSYTHGKTIQAIRATDCHGGEWYGRGNPGIVITLRPCKG